MFRPILLMRDIMQSAEVIVDSVGTSSARLLVRDGAELKPSHGKRALRGPPLHT